MTPHPGLSIHETGILQFPRSKCKEVSGDRNMKGWRRRQSLPKNQACWPPLPFVHRYHHSPLSRRSVSLPCLTQWSLPGTALVPQRLKVTCSFLIYLSFSAVPEFKQAPMSANCSIPITSAAYMTRDLHDARLHILSSPLLSATGTSAVYLIDTPPSTPSASHSALCIARADDPVFSLGTLNYLHVRTLYTSIGV